MQLLGMKVFQAEVRNITVPVDYNRSFTLIANAGCAKIKRLGMLLSSSFWQGCKKHGSTC